MGKKFENLEELYGYIEKNAWDYEYYQIGKIFSEFKHSLKDSDLDGKKAQWELDFFYFNTRMGKIEPSISKTSEDGKVHHFPNSKNFDKDTYIYLIRRLFTTKNLLLKARYTTILWNSPEKHRKYAEIAVDSYLKLVELYEIKDLKEPSKNYGIKIVESIKNAYGISLSSKYNVEKVKSEIKRLIHHFNFHSNNTFYLRKELILLMLNEKRKFIKTDFNRIENILWKLAEISIIEKDYHKAIIILELGIRVENRLDTKKFNWEKSIAESYESLMDDADKKDDDSRIYFCENALKHHKNLKNDSKISELEEKYTKYNSSRKLSKIETPIDLTDTLTRCQEIAEEIVSSDSSKIIIYLMHSEKILPDLKDVEKFVDEEMLKYFSSRIPTAALDDNGHVMQRFSEPDELRYYQILKHYKMTLELNTNNLLYTVILTAIKSNKLSYDILINQLIQKSWIGKTFEKKLHDGKIIRKNWLNLISPSLYEYFDQINLFLLDPTYEPNFVLIIDSLILKLEGLLRDICQNILGISTFYQTQDKKRRNIEREKDINALLHVNELKSLFSEDEILFFKFLLVEKAGYNLRHKIAHSLANDKEYQIGIFHLILLALLRLGKYDYVESKEQESKEQESKEQESKEQESKEQESKEQESKEQESKEDKFGKKNLGKNLRKKNLGKNLRKKNLGKNLRKKNLKKKNPERRISKRKISRTRILGSILS